MEHMAVYDALQQNTLDGENNSPGLIYSSKFYQVLNYYSVTRHVYANCPIIIGADFFYGLSEEHQEIIREGARIYLQDWQRAEESAIEEDYLEKLERGGTQVNYLEPESIEAFREAVQPLYDSYRTKLGAELMGRVLELSKKDVFQ